MAQGNINTQAYWDERWTNKPMFSRKLEHVLITLVEPGESVIDIGFGSGRMLRSYKKDKGSRVLGLDISRVAVEGLKKRGIPAIVADAENLTGTFEHFDVALLSHTLEHVTNDEELIKRISRFAKRLIVVVPNDSIGPEEEHEHVRKYTKESLSALGKKYFSRFEDKSFGIHLILIFYA